MKKRLATFLLTGILLTGCHKAIVTQISSSQNVVSAVKSAIEKEFEDIAVQANQGDAEAQYSLAVMYDEGEGTREDNAKAIEWYTKSANQGYDLAQYNLAIMYDEGEGVDQDRSTAIEWFTKAANQGYANMLKLNLNLVELTTITMAKVQTRITIDISSGVQKLSIKGLVR